MLAKVLRRLFWIPLEFHWKTVAASIFLESLPQRQDLRPQLQGALDPKKKTDPAPLRSRRDQLDLRTSLFGSGKRHRVLRRGENCWAECGGGKNMGIAAWASAAAFLLRQLIPVLTIRNTD